MATIVVQHGGWVGLKTESYKVLIDDKVVGRLGRRTKRLETLADEGAHTVEVVGWGQSSGVITVEAQEGELLVALVFPLSYLNIFWRMVRHRSGASTQSPRGDVMRLVPR